MKWYLQPDFSPNYTTGQTTSPARQLLLVRGLVLLLQASLLLWTFQTGDWVERREGVDSQPGPTQFGCKCKMAKESHASLCAFCMQSFY